MQANQSQGKAKSCEKTDTGLKSSEIPLLGVMMKKVFFFVGNSHTKFTLY